MTRRSSGFTLIEILVALALFALISTILVSSLELGGRTWALVERSVQGVEGVATAQRQMRQSLESAHPAESTAEVSIAGGDNSIEFSAPAPAAIHNGLWRYRYLVTADNSLVVQTQRPQMSGASVDWATETLVKQVAGVSFRYFGSVEAHPPGWSTRWPGSAPLPRLIEIVVEFPATDHRRWPPLYIAPLIDTPVSCAFDVISRRCRAQS